MITGPQLHTLALRIARATVPRELRLTKRELAAAQRFLRRYRVRSAALRKSVPLSPLSLSSDATHIRPRSSVSLVSDEDADPWKGIDVDAPALITSIEIATERLVDEFKFAQLIVCGGLEDELVKHAWREWRDTRPTGEAWPSKAPGFFIRDELGFSPGGVSVADTFARQQELDVHRAAERELRVQAGGVIPVDVDTRRLCERCDIALRAGEDLLCRLCHSERLESVHKDDDDDAFSIFESSEPLYPLDEIDWHLPDGGRREPRLTPSGAQSRRTSVLPVAQDAATAITSLLSTTVTLPHVDSRGRRRGVRRKVVRDRSLKAKRVSMRLGVDRDRLLDAIARRGTTPDTVMSRALAVLPVDRMRALFGMPPTKHVVAGSEK